VIFHPHIYARAWAADLEDRHYGFGNADGGSLTSLTTPIAWTLVMSALTLIADIGTQSCDVRFVPKADITSPNFYGA
jgi:hypothetical protein